MKFPTNLRMLFLPCRNIYFDHCHNRYSKPYRGIERKDTLCDFGELVLLSSPCQSLCKCPLLKPRIAVGAQFVESINNGNETWPAKCDPMTSHQDLEQCTAQSTVVVSPDLTQLFALEEVWNGKVALETEKFKTCNSWRIYPPPQPHCNSNLNWEPQGVSTAPGPTVCSVNFFFYLTDPT